MKRPVTIKLLATLQNLLGMYECDRMEVLVLEAVANGMDAGADTISISFERDLGEHYIVFHNNGDPMNKVDFENYHTVSSSTKKKGESIGFAGVGAKIFMAAWPYAEIITITGEGNNVLVSKMWREKQQDDEGEIVWESNTDGISAEDITKRTALNHPRGTTYKVKVPYEGYEQLREHLKEILQRSFNLALISKELALTVENVPVLPWMPRGKKIQKTTTPKNSKVLCHIWIADEDIPNNQRHITYYVYGKRIKHEMVDWVAQLKPRYEKHVHCMADVTTLANHLTTNKEGFERNFYTNKIISAVKRTFYEVLKSNGCLHNTSEEINDSKIMVNELTKRLNKVLLTPELRQFNPFTKTVKQDLPFPSDDGNTGVGETLGPQDPTRPKRGSGNHNDVIGESSDKDRHFENNESKNPKKNRERKSKGIGIIPVNAPQDPREGWLDPSTKAVVYNIGHPFYKRIEKNRSLQDYNLTRVVVSSLIKSKNAEITMDAATTFKHFEDILHKVWL